MATDGVNVEIGAVNGKITKVEAEIGAVNEKITKAERKKGAVEAARDYYMLTEEHQQRESLRSAGGIYVCGNWTLDKVEKVLTEVKEDLKRLEHSLDRLYGDLELLRQQLLKTLEPDSKKARHELFEHVKLYHRVACESSNKSQALLELPHLKGKKKRCFLCGVEDGTKVEGDAGGRAIKIDGSHVVQKADVSPLKNDEDRFFDTFDVLKNWIDGRTWKRAFEFNKPMNLILLCHNHNLAFDQYKFCLKVDLRHVALFHSFGVDDEISDLVEKANERLCDETQPYFDLGYVSRRAIGMRILQAQLKQNRYLDPNNDRSWEPIVNMSRAVSAKSDDDDDDDDDGDDDDELKLDDDDLDD